ncbi:ATP-binding protein [Clavibacter michiganensis]|nr:ATP-binding protein [Clavibacter michiganensis]
MDGTTNPYAPGAGARPPALVGRDAELEAWHVSVARAAAGRAPRSLVLYGLRGVGKTVLLSQMSAEAEASGWIVAQIEAAAGTSMRGALSSSLQSHVARIARRNRKRPFLRALKTALSFSARVDTDGTTTFGLTLDDVEAELADSGNIELDLTTVVDGIVDAVHDEGVGLAILIDEAQDLTADELVAICTVAHRASQRQRPVLFVLAGLPSLPTRLAEAKSYSERLFQYRHIRELEPEAAAAALTVPAGDEGVTWTVDAIDLVVTLTGGYPYFLQEYGSEAWLEAASSPIARDDAQNGAGLALRHLDDGFYRTRWDRATPLEKDYLRAMAADGDIGSKTSDVAHRLDRTTQRLSKIRQNLTDKGIIYAPEHGRIAFTVPWMSAFIERQPT